MLLREALIARHREINGLAAEALQGLFMRWHSHVYAAEWKLEVGNLWYRQTARW